MSVFRAGIYAWRESDMTPDPTSTWDTYEARLARYALYSGYYNNSVYDEVKYKLRWFRQERKLYKYPRGLRNPVTRLIDLRTAKCYGGSINYQDLTSGAIPILQADDNLREAIKQVFLWSNWGVAKSLFVRNGAMLGDSVIKVVDEPDKRKVRLEVLHPGKIREVDRDAVGNIKRAVIEYEDQDEITPGNFKSFMYREDIDGEWFRTFKDNRAWDYINNVADGEFSEWPNLYGFVPMAIAHDKDLGLNWGVNAFHNTISKIDDVNDSASALNDYLRRAMNPMWAAIGVDAPKPVTDGRAVTVNANSDKRDEEKIIYAPKDSTFQSLVHNVQVGDALASIAAQMQELRDDLPELALAELRNGGQLTAPGVRAGYSDAIDRLTESNGNYDDALIRAVQMAISIGALGGYDGFRPYSLDSFARGDLAFYIKEREIVEDKLTTEQQITAWQASGVPQRKIWSLLGATEDEIAEWEQEKQRKEMLALVMKNQGQLSNGAQPNQSAQLSSGIQGDPLPPDQATADTPITPEQVAMWNAKFAMMDKVIKNG